MNVGTYAFIPERDLAYSFTVLFFISVCSETIHNSHSIFLVCKPQPSAAFLLLPGSKTGLGKDDRYENDFAYSQCSKGLERDIFI